MLRSRYCYSHLPYHLLRGVRSVPSSWYLLMQQVLLLSLCTCSPSCILLLSHLYRTPCSRHLLCLGLSTYGVQVPVSPFARCLYTTQARYLVCAAYTHACAPSQAKPKVLAHLPRPVARAPVKYLVAHTHARTHARQTKRGQAKYCCTATPVAMPQSSTLRAAPLGPAAPLCWVAPLGIPSGLGCGVPHPWGGCPAGGLGWLCVRGVSLRCILTRARARESRSGMIREGLRASG